MRERSAGVRFLGLTRIRAQQRFSAPCPSIPARPVARATCSENASAGREGDATVKRSSSQTHRLPARACCFRVPSPRDGQRPERHELNPARGGELICRRHVGPLTFACHLPFSLDREMARKPATLATKVRYDDSEWPIFRIMMPQVSLSSADFQAHLDHMDRVFERGTPFVVLVDARKAPALCALERRLIAERMRAAIDRGPERLRAFAVALDSNMARGAFTAVKWLVRPPFPMSAFDSVSSARVWLKKQLEADTLPAEHTAVTNSTGRH